MTTMAHRPLSTLLGYKTFETFTKALCVSHDLAPIYRIIPQIAQHEGFDVEWFVFIYCLYTSISAAVHFCRRIADPNALCIDRFEQCSDLRIVGTARNRPLLFKAMQSFCQAAGAIRHAACTHSHDAFVGRLRLLVSHDLRAAKLLAECYERALGHPNLTRTELGIDDADVNANKGAAAGCRAMYAVGTSARFEPSIAPQWEALGKTIADRLNISISDVSIALSKWGALCQGRYFIGHDIYAMRELTPLFGKTSLCIMMAQAGFKKRLWFQKIDERAAKGAYAKYGVLLNREFATHKMRLATNAGKDIA